MNIESSDLLSTTKSKQSLLDESMSSQQIASANDFVQNSSTSSSSSQVDDRFQATSATEISTTTTTTTTTSSTSGDSALLANDLVINNVSSGLESGLDANKAIINIAPLTVPTTPSQVTAAADSFNSVLVNTVRSADAEQAQENSKRQTIQVVQSEQHMSRQPLTRSATQRITSSPPPLPPPSMPDLSSMSSRSGVNVQRINVNRVDDPRSSGVSQSSENINRINVVANNASSLNPAANSLSVNNIYNSMMMTTTAEDGDDVMYNSLKRLSNMTAMSTTRLKKILPVAIPFKNLRKELTFTLNEAVFTHGDLSKLNSEKSSSYSELLSDKMSRKNIYKRQIRSIGTSLENCDTSDMISIDIEPESTKLPLMCKLMIIVEGAAYERGTRVLVRDASIQVGTEEDEANRKSRNESSSSNETRIRVEKSSPGNDENSNNRTTMSHIPISIQTEPGYLEKSIFIPTTLNNKFLFNSSSNSQHMCRHRSIESLNLDSLRNQGGTTITLSRSPRSSHRCHHSAHHQHQISGQQPLGSSISRIRIHNSGSNASASRLSRNMCGGSLNSLTSTSSSASSASSQHPFAAIQMQDEASSSNYFNKKKRNSHVQSHLDVNEYTSIPYYQYQRKDLLKKDFCSDTAELYQYSYASSSRSNSSARQVKVNVATDLCHDGEELVEVNIPIGIMPQEIHRNEKHIMITHGHGCSDSADSMLSSSYTNSFSDRMKRYIDERINKFEAEITFFNLDSNTRASNPVISFKQPSPASVCNGYAHLGGFSSLNHRHHHQHHYRHHHHHGPMMPADHPSLSYTYHYESQNSKNFASTEPSVTHLMLMQIVDGRLLDQ